MSPVLAAMLVGLFGIAIAGRATARSVPRARGLVTTGPVPLSLLHLPRAAAAARTAVAALFSLGMLLHVAATWRDRGRF